VCLSKSVEQLGLDWARKMCEDDNLAVRKTVRSGREGSLGRNMLPSESTLMVAESDSIMLIPFCQTTRRLTPKD
jgi:hypothetical protein